MKKTYIEPQAEVIAIRTSQLICTSLPIGGDTGSGGIISGDSPEFDLDLLPGMGVPGMPGLPGAPESDPLNILLE